MSSIPWTEAYRPTKFDDIVLDPSNKLILTNIIKTGYFPNLLFFGPPGTGKTTTIINLVSAYQEKYHQKNKELMIHLNASDERGIDIIRNQINQFVNSKTLFNKGMKFVILDEVDYMTKNAQQALRYLLQIYSSNVRFCLICNYISRIDDGLQNEFLRLSFNQIPVNDVDKFLSHISSNEQLKLSTKSLSLIRQLYKSDIRSMINFMQSNQNLSDYNFNIVSESVWNELLSLFLNSTSKNDIINHIYNISRKYSIDKKNIIKDFLNYVIRQHDKFLSVDFMNFIENIMNADEYNNEYYVHYSVCKMQRLLKEL